MHYKQTVTQAFIFTCTFLNQVLFSELQHKYLLGEMYGSSVKTLDKLLRVHFDYSHLKRSLCIRRDKHILQRKNAERGV